jgi:Predicted membrane protein
MKSIIYAMKDLFGNFFNWRGRLSKEGYIWTWAGILAVEAGLLFLRKIMLFLALFSNYSYDEPISKIMAYAITMWNAVIFFPVMFATMRRYHDSGKAGWKVILFNGLSLIFIAFGLFIGGFLAIGFIFAGGYMVTAGTDVAMSGLLGLAVLSACLLLAGVGLAILNIKYILQQSDPMENVYGKPTPFNTD